MNTPLSREHATRDVARSMSDKQFYEVHRDLRPFDNGDGLFTNGENRDIEAHELRAHGEALLRLRGEYDSDRARQEAVGAQDLLRALQSKHPAEARYVINSVLDSNARRLFMRHGGLALYDEVLQVQIAARGYPSRFGEETPCDKHNSFALVGDELRVSRVSEHFSNATNQHLDRCTIDELVLRLDRVKVEAPIVEAVRRYCSIDAKQQLQGCSEQVLTRPRSEHIEHVGLLSPFHGAMLALSDTAAGHDAHYQLFLYREMLKAVHPHRVL